MNPRPRLVVVGNGMAGMRTVETLLELAPEAYDITVFGAEPHPAYNRILLSPVLAGEQSFDDTVLIPYAWYAARGITLHTGSPVVALGRGVREVRSAAGITARYDRLLLATGARPIVLPVPGHDLAGVLGYRDIADTDAMIAAARDGGPAVVIGGGLLGLEAANGLRARGMDVTVVHLMPTLMERQLDDTAGRLLQASLAARGIRFVLPATTRALLGDTAGHVAAVELADGSRLPARLVVMAVGIRPEIALARAAGLQCRRGILVDDTLQTYDPRIYAVGECVEHRDRTYGLVAPLFEMAKVAANHLAARGHARYTGSVTSTKLKVTGIDLFSAGDFEGGADTDTIVLSDPRGGQYKKLVLREDKLVGTVLYGNTVDGAWYFQLMREGRQLADLRDRLIFGAANLGDSGHEGQNRALQMSDDAEVCGCNGVCKGVIVRAIREQKLFTLDEVRRQTKASASCGSCTGLVEQLLVSTVGADYSPMPTAKPLCRCTDHTHAEVRRAIRDAHLLTIPAVMRHLDWRDPHGCASCRPALNYYLLSTWPHEFTDDPQSRFINERAHANIQKDGSFSVVPRMWGGVTNAAELRRIADVVERYAIPTVKVTGGQRIDLLGVRKEDLPAVWRDLDMPSGHAYAKALRTVKTCVGSEWCRFGVQDSTQLGIDLERALWRMYAPHKVKLAVSGCPRNCAESGIKDVGVIGVDSGWEIYVAGNGGIKTEVAQFFVKVATAAEVLEHASAFLQLYREEGWYLERTVHFVARVGLDYCKRMVVEDATKRRALHARLRDALRDLPDPWVAQQDAADAHEYVPLRPSVPA